MQLVIYVKYRLRWANAPTIRTCGTMIQRNFAAALSTTAAAVAMKIDSPHRRLAKSDVKGNLNQSLSLNRKQCSHRSMFASWNLLLVIVINTNYTGITRTARNAALNFIGVVVVAMAIALPRKKNVKDNVLQQHHQRLCHKQHQLNHKFVPNQGLKMKMYVPWTRTLVNVMITLTGGTSMLPHHNVINFIMAVAVAMAIDLPQCKIV